jgi:hypothetical protein
MSGASPHAGLTVGRKTVKFRRGTVVINRIPRLSGGLLRVDLSAN